MPDSGSDSDRPRERLWRLGAASLTHAELLAVIVGTGDRLHDSLEIAMLLLKPADGVLRRLAARPPGALMLTTGVGRAKAGRLLAAFELADRLAGTGTERRIRSAFLLVEVGLNDRRSGTKGGAASSRPPHLSCLLRATA